MTGASVTNKGERLPLRGIFEHRADTFPLGIYYEPGKEPPPEGPPKLHLLIESNEEFRVRHLVRGCSYFQSYRPRDRWRMQYAKSNGFLSKLRQLHSKRRCATLLHQLGATALYKPQLFHVCLYLHHFQLRQSIPPLERISSVMT